MGVNLIPKLEIERLLRRLGLPGTHAGYRCWVYGLQLTLEDPSRLDMLMKRFYPEIAAHFPGSTPGSVERAMCRANEMIWDEGDRELLERICHHKLVRRPTNGELADGLAFYLTQRMR